MIGLALGFIVLVVILYELAKRHERLYWAARAGREWEVRLLLAVGAGHSVYKDAAGDRAIHAASYRGHVTVLKLLLKAGADKNKIGCLHQTPLLWASSTGKTDVVRALLDAGADKSVKNNRGKTALDLAREHTEKPLSGKKYAAMLALLEEESEHDAWAPQSVD